MALSVAISLSDLELEDTELDALTYIFMEQKVKTAKKKSRSNIKRRKFDIDDNNNSNNDNNNNNDNDNNNNNNNSIDNKNNKFNKRISRSSKLGMKSVSKTSKNKKRGQRHPRKNKSDSEDTEGSIVPQDSQYSGSTETEAEAKEDSALPPSINFFEGLRFYQHLLNPVPMVIGEMLCQQPMTREESYRLKRPLGGMVTKNKQPRVMYNQRNILNLEANLRNFNWQVTWKVGQDGSTGVSSEGQLDEDFDCDVLACCSHCDFEEPI
ncbi:probable serine/threonine-protein kinase DDB_G0272254 [Cotesia glomerata]|uniref:Uncharacterized protein n=1 Tax=Cotesia glomerata TaxID=32391 RepID=A0AAV7I9I1_COTGL|nr:probable serine/threonine-protein kinase DDB_G0272254 [Cotesia glomerata]KAH0549000.1 hypothetical protein KQX54_005051 [Cotesia glomerata]